MNSTNVNMNAEGVAMIIAGVSAAIVAIIYAMKHIKHSDCGCISCDQQVPTEHILETIPEENPRKLVFV